MCSDEGNASEEELNLLASCDVRHSMSGVKSHSGHHWQTFTAMLHSVWGGWGGTAWAGLHSPHVHTIAVPYVARFVMTGCRLVKMMAVFHWPVLSLPATPIAPSCASAGVITQQGHFTVVCKHTHAHTHMPTLTGVGMSYTSGAGGWRDGWNGCRKGEMEEGRKRRRWLQLLHRLILIQLFSLLASVVKGWEPKTVPLWLTQCSLIVTCSFYLYMTSLLYSWYF